MTAESSSKTKNTRFTNKGKEILDILDGIDKAVSIFMFRLSLPPIVEAIYSIPANFFGLVPSITIFPLWIALLALDEGAVSNGGTENRDGQQQRKVLILKSIAVLLTILFLVAWGLYQIGNTPLEKVMAQKYFYLLGICFNVGFLTYTFSESPSDDPYSTSSMKAFSVAIYLLFLWPLSMLVILILKMSSQRLRPVAFDATRKRESDRWLDKKAFPNICHFLASHQPNESFPSGDALSAAIFAILLVNVSPRYTIHAWSILLLVCTGRMYVLAHHFLDVVAGSILACVMHRVASSIGLGIYDMRWWYPFASTAFLAVLVKTVWSKPKAA